MYVHLLGCCCCCGSCVCVSAWRSNLRWWEAADDIRICTYGIGAHVKAPGRSTQKLPPKRGALSTNLAGTARCILRGWLGRYALITSLWVSFRGVWSRRRVRQSRISQNNSNGILVIVMNTSHGYMDKRLVKSSAIPFWVLFIDGLV